MARDAEHVANEQARLAKRGARVSDRRKCNKRGFWKSAPYGAHDGDCGEAHGEARRAALAIPPAARTLAAGTPAAISGPAALSTATADGSSQAAASLVLLVSHCLFSLIFLFY
eukprot:TRINITY_DN608_c0_g1_i5.p3 TRINITY_DN608_c0_g1~~TRINITY_DN608_c0_g1_i5.p3  ORF type:complete len:113 (+),score=8.60 TRINITY_DN608_c0_g1_i5:164-502(+)